jgi:hypothetical protein
MSLNAVVDIAENNGYRREIALYNQTANKPATKWKMDYI